MQKITPFLWFNDDAEQAIELYVSIFKHSKIVSINRRGAQGPVVSATFELEGQRFMALNGGPHYSFTPAISLFVDCADQAEVDELWEKLSAGGRSSQCGWLVDRFGLSWQIIPRVLGELLGDSDPERAQRTMQAMLKMGKLDVAALQRASAGE